MSKLKNTREYWRKDREEKATSPSEIRCDDYILVHPVTLEAFLREQEWIASRLNRSQ